MDTADLDRRIRSERRWMWLYVALVLAGVAAAALIVVGMWGRW